MGAMIIIKKDQFPFSHLIASRDIKPNILGSFLDNNMITPQGVHEELKEILSSGDIYTYTHEREENYDEGVMLHVSKLKTFLIEEPIVDPLPKKEPNEKDPMSEELGATFLLKDMHTQESPRIKVPHMQDQCMMMT